MEKDLIQKLLFTDGDDLYGDGRITRHTLFMCMAKFVSYRGTCNRGGRAGAVIVNDGRIISMGYVGSPPGQPHCLDVGHIIDSITGGCIRTLHAEANAVAWAARKGISIDGTTMYCTLQPCLACAKVIASSGISSVIYLNEYRDKEGIRLLTRCNIHNEKFKIA